jgi:hypothetical protein
MYKDLQGHLAIRVARTSDFGRYSCFFNWHRILKLLGVQIGVQLAEEEDTKHPHPANQAL